MAVPTGKIKSAYFGTDDFNFTKICNIPDHDKLLALCGKAERQERIGTWHVFVEKHPNAMLIRPADTDYDCAVKIMEWINKYDMNKPMDEQSITPALINSDDFVKVVALYWSVGSMNISREHRGQNLRNEIMHYMGIAPLSANEFIMIYETCSFDQGLVNKMLNEFAYAYDKDGKPGKHVYPADQEKEIVEFCQERGILGGMMHRQVLQKIWAADQAKFQAKNQAKGKKTYEGTSVCAM